MNGRVWPCTSAIGDLLARNHAMKTQDSGDSGRLRPIPNGSHAGRQAKSLFHPGMVRRHWPEYRVKEHQPFVQLRQSDTVYQGEPCALQ